MIGGGPAGLMAAEVLAQQGVSVHLYDAMPSVGRKLLLAGRGGLNLTHAEPFDAFLSRYPDRHEQVTPLLQQFGPQALRDWVHGLGIDTFVGSSSRVFPTDMKAAPLLRAWLVRLRRTGVHIHARHRWLGWSDNGELLLQRPEGAFSKRVDACILALGGASWSRLGSDGAWLPILRACDIPVDALQPSNCGFDVRSGWSAHLRSRFAGQPVKPVALTFTGSAGETFSRQGELMLSDSGIEGGLVYAVSAQLRDEITRHGSATLHLNLLPDFAADQLQRRLEQPRGSQSLSTHLQRRAGLKGLKIALLHELLAKEDLSDMAILARRIQALPLTLTAARPIDEAISSAGGVRFEALDRHLILRQLPGVFCAGEMLDWEAPTGGYLLTACMASGRVAGQGVLEWLRRGRDL